MNRTGVIVFAVFGAVWCSMGLEAMTGAVDVLTFAPALVAVAIIVIALKMGRIGPDRGGEQGKRIWRVIGLATAFEVVAMPIVGAVLGSIGREDLLMPAIAAIVGLHLLPIAWVTRYLPFLVVAVALLGLAAGSLLLPPTAVRTMVVGFGAGMLLWIVCGLALMRAAKVRSAA